jgi:hypothetical protein
LDSTVSGQGPVAGCCEYGDEPSGSCATELVLIFIIPWEIKFRKDLLDTGCGQPGFRGPRGEELGVKEYESVDIFLCLRTRITGKLCELANEPWSSMKGGEFFDLLATFLHGADPFSKIVDRGSNSCIE